MLSDWIPTLSLIFGGCCSNALTLEQLTHDYPHAGKLLTFCQFLLITLYGLPRFVSLKPYPHLKPRRIPLLPFLVQVVIFYSVSLLNNAAFAYSIPMPVHIIFRSAGLVISMLLNWVILGRRYSTLQILSVISVTLGVVVTTLSASAPRPKPRSTLVPNSDAAADPLRYAMGIAILTLALVLSGLLGIVQDRMYAKYGRPAPGAGRASKVAVAKNQTAPWEESMFYLHFLSMPMFFLMRNELLAQFHAISAGPKYDITLPYSPHYTNSSQPIWYFADADNAIITPGRLLIPKAFVPLLLNSITQLFCVAGVHRLTSRVSSLTVTLILVVRKAVSLVISVMLFSTTGVRAFGLWSGAFLVFLGTVSYSLGGVQKSIPKEKPKKD
ncbi:hypothetical protein IEO21_00990 [Rhodonia placenta]|uniref:UAA transporter n=1 Tax=Rhodonia placenta TaxID=104341 RepID=A0A8H7U695_9APHY|nr:hypothetical protein IEO21_00990 [Postia placenta]